MQLLNIVELLLLLLIDREKEFKMWLVKVVHLELVVIIVLIEPIFFRVELEL